MKNLADGSKFSQSFKNFAKFAPFHNVFMAKRRLAAKGVAC
jgi:hypothetical protein